MKLKKAIALILALLMLVSIIPVTALAEGEEEVETEAEEFVLSVNPYGNAEDSLDTIKWYKGLGVYYLFLPAGCDTSAMTVYFNSSEKVFANGRELISGEATDVFSTCDKFVIQCGLVPYALIVLKSENIPAMYIETEKPMDYVNADKENKSKGNIRTFEGGEMTLDSELKQIKGRGNSSWNYDKKSYNIKFDEKTPLLGMEKAKKWSMIACYIDPAFVKNPLGWELSNQMGLNFAADYRFVDLYVNGEYYGTYTICESVEVGESRVNITDLTKATEKVNKDTELEDFPVGGTGENGLPTSVSVMPNAKWVNIPNDPKDITGGYLLECEYHSRYDNEVSAFVSERGQPIIVKEPEFASEAQVRYISNYWQEAEDAICAADGYNSLGKHYSEYFDIDSLVNMYILLELSGNNDSGISSTFFYKDVGGKLTAGPIWDCDTSFGNFSVRQGVVLTDPTIWVASRMNYSSATRVPTGDEYPTIYNRLYQRADFRELVSQRWAELKDVMNANKINGFVNSLADELESSAVMNGIRWYGVFTKEIYRIAVGTTTSYMTERIANLNRGFGKNAANLYYDPNGGTGWSMENRIMVNGEYAVVNGPYNSDATNIEDAESILDIDDATTQKIAPPTEGMEFAGWNTKPDGSGKTYQPGALIRMNGTTTLYAQWKPVQPSKCMMSYDYAWVLDNPLFDFTLSIVHIGGTYYKNINQIFSFTKCR